MNSITNPTPPRLQRSQDKTIAGVAAGLADYTDVDVSIVRLGFIALTLFGGSGPLLYVAAWLILPQAPVAPMMQPPPPAPAAPVPPAPSTMADSL